MKWWAAAHGGENIAFKLADLPFFGDIRECHYQVLQMREHVINRADRGFNPDFFTWCASTAEIRPDRGRFSIATAVNEYGYQQGILECSGVYRAAYRWLR